MVFSSPLDLSFKHRARTQGTCILVVGRPNVPHKAEELLGCILSYSVKIKNSQPRKAVVTSSFFWGSRNIPHCMRRKQSESYCCSLLSRKVGRFNEILFAECAELFKRAALWWVYMKKLAVFHNYYEAFQNSIPFWQNIIFRAIKTCNCSISGNLGFWSIFPKVLRNCKLEHLFEWWHQWQWSLVWGRRINYI